MAATAEPAERIRTVEMHTGGEPLRIVVSGYPPILGATLLEKRRYALENLDDYRKMIMLEPRGHSDMYGALLVDKDNQDADLAVLFIHNEGYSTMCGHGVIALGRYAIDYKLVKPVSPETPVKIQCPCGLVTAYTQYNAETGKTGQTRFESVPAFAFAIDQTIDVVGYGTVKYDIGYGGAFYALVDTHQLNLDIRSSPVHELVIAADAISSAVKKQVKLSHPESADLAFLYGTILTDGNDQYSGADGEPTYNLTVFAEKEVDRSPTGSGVTTRIAVQFHKKQIQLNETRVFLNAKVGSKFTGKPHKVIHYGCYDDAVIVEVSGYGYYIGESSFWQEKDDPLRNGFLVK